MSNNFNNIFKYNSLIYRIIILLVSITLIVYWLPKGSQFSSEYQKGKPWIVEDLFAPFDFAISKSDSEIKEEENNIKANITYYFTINNNIKDDVIDKFKSSIIKIGNDRSYDKTYLNRMLSFGVKQLEDIYEYGVLEKSDKLKIHDKDIKVVLLKDNVANDIIFSQFYTINSVLIYIDQKINFSEFENDIAFLDEVIISALQQNVRYDVDKTETELNDNLKSISYTRGFIEKGTRIISKGDIVEGNKLEILNSLKSEYNSKTLNETNYLWITIGHVIKVSILLVMLMWFLSKYKENIYNNDNEISFVYLNVLLVVGLTSAVIHYNADLIYIIPVAIAPIVLNSFFDSRIGIMTHIIIILLVGLMAPNSYEYVFIQVTAGVVTILSVPADHRRASMFISVGQITLVYFITYFAYSISQDGSLESINYKVFLFFAISGLLTLFSQPLIYLYEKIFKLVSDVSLLELSDTNNALLKELSDKAPGTFQHSLMVANIAESAANEIGANARLVRTGAMYHDIGKMLNPLYFIENQQTHVNPHDEIDPKESARIIINHVLDGVEIAKKHNLPDRVIDFIRTHHGESMVYYFYRQYEETSNEVLLSDKSFRYPGPTPYSRETAILMMSDALEAASRSLKTYDSRTIGDLVEKIVSKQMEEGQFNNCNITFRDIDVVKRVITKKLLNIYHARIEYPD